MEIIQAACLPFLASEFVKDQCISHSVLCDKTWENLFLISDSKCLNLDCWWLINCLIVAVITERSMWLLFLFSVPLAISTLYSSKRLFTHLDTDLSETVGWMWASSSSCGVHVCWTVLDTSLFESVHISRFVQNSWMDVSFLVVLWVHVC